MIRGLVRCRTCGRILLKEHVEKGRCRDRGDCATAALIAAAAANDNGELVRGLEGRG